MNSSSNATKSPSAGSLSLEFIRELHVIAFSCCLCSVVASCSVIVLSFVMKGYRVPLRKKPMMDRLVIYLAIGDIFFTASHGIDHIILYANNETTNFFVCKICAFFFHWGLDASCMIASFVAVSAFIGVVLGKKVQWPSFDIALLSVSFLIPGLLSIVGVSVGWFGFAGLWCGIDINLPIYSTLAIVYEAVFPWITVTVGTFCYSAIPIKLCVSAQRLRRSGLAESSSNSGMNRLATQFTVFILILYLQWLSLFVFFIVNFSNGKLTPFNYQAAVSFTNLGGVYNAFAYTFLRLRNRVSPENSSTK